MILLHWFRFIPTPGYGKCGGANRDCSISKPRDWMDLAFEEHDNDLNEADKFETKAMRKAARQGADRKLGKTLREGDKSKLGWYGRLYLFGAKIVFRP